MKRDLIYLAYGGNNYTKVADLCLNSLKKYISEQDNIDILVLTDKNTIVNHNLVYRLDKKVHPSMFRNYIYDYPNINNYDKILYIDCDVLAINNIKTLFQENIKYERLYVIQQGDFQNDMTTGLLKFTDEKIIEMTKNNSLPFYSGQFFFRNCNVMKYYFIKLHEMHDIYFKPSIIYIDQKIINYNFNVNLISCAEILGKYFTMFAKSSTKPKKDTIFLHFCGYFFNSNYKISEMQSYIKKNNLF